MTQQQNLHWRLKPEIKTLDEQIRLHHCPVPIVAITGGLGSGKSTVIELLKAAGLFNLSADQLIKEAYQMPAPLAYLRDHCPETLTPKIDFHKLRDWAFTNPDRLRVLEKILYQELPALFLAHLKLIAPLPNLIIYEIPLLFEKNLNQKVDLILTVYSSEKKQRERALKRDGSSPETIEKILAQQIALSTKIKKSHIVIHNDGSLDELKKQVSDVLSLYFLRS